MKREWIISIVSICTLSVVLVLLSQVSYSQITSCKSPSGSNPCTANNNATFNDGQNTGCKVEYRYINCSDAQKEAHLTCTNIGCKQDCSCSCQVSPPGMASSWLHTCTEPNVVRSESESCNGCPTGQEDCVEEGMYWNFSQGGCYSEPQTCGGHCVPYYPLEAGGCESPVDYCAFQWGCGFGLTDGGSGCCCGPTPILIDVAGNGFALTDAYTGVNFDMGGDGHSEPIAWTRAGSDDAWLVLDRNNNGKIDSAKEMFGNFTDQPNATTERHGFIALAEFDRPENGGNSDGKIQKTDSVFASLRLWQDLNKNGFSEPSELRSLKEFGLKTIELDFKESKRTDQFGNQFKYRARIIDNNDAQMGRWAWDVVLQVNPPPRP